jgi:hypothetical protein
MDRAKLFRGFGVVAFLTVLLLQAFPAPENPRDKEEETLARLADSGRVQELYRKWEARHQRQGGERNVSLPLGYFRGLSVANTRARGRATLDLIEGSVSVQVSGLPVETISDVWLVDNQPGPGRSARPEPGDEVLYLGSLRGDSSRATLETTVAPGTFERFMVDAVVISRSGQDPVEGPVLFGSPGTFQRLYTRARLQRDPGSEANPDLPPARLKPTLLFGASAAYAAGSILADPDVLLNALVAEGANIYFNQQFEGNGRTCATCHPSVNNFTIDPGFIASLPNSAPRSTSTRRRWAGIEPPLSNYSRYRWPSSKMRSRFLTAPVCTPRRSEDSEPPLRQARRRERRF